MTLVEVKSSLGALASTFIKNCPQERTLPEACRVRFHYHAEQMLRPRRLSVALNPTLAGTG